jgi:glycosyltransferase involved in cell wall biosynthesis
VDDENRAGRGRRQELGLLTSISLIIPCYNEAALLPRLLATVETARRAYRGDPADLEIIVSDNDSTDATATIAAAAGCRVAFTATRCIAAARNAGAAIAQGSVVAFIDADSQIHPDTFNFIAGCMAEPGLVGGATGATMERWSPGIVVCHALLLQIALATGLDIGVVFCRRADFDAIGGYDETLRFAEDIKLLFDLRRIGKARGARLLRRRRGAIAIASTRKFDQFGEWHFLAMIVKSPWYFLNRRAGDAFADSYWYRSGRR